METLGWRPRPMTHVTGAQMIGGLAALGLARASGAEMDQLILRRARTPRLVQPMEGRQLRRLCGRQGSGRILGHRSGRHWMWKLVLGYREDRTPTHGNEAFAKNWRWPIRMSRWRQFVRVGQELEKHAILRGHLADMNLSAKFSSD